MLFVYNNTLYALLKWKMVSNMKWFEIFRSFLTHSWSNWNFTIKKPWKCQQILRASWGFWELLLLFLRTDDAGRKILWHISLYKYQLSTRQTQHGLDVVCVCSCVCACGNTNRKLATPWQIAGGVGIGKNLS